MQRTTHLKMGHNYCTIMAYQIFNKQSVKLEVGIELLSTNSFCVWHKPFYKASLVINDTIESRLTYGQQHI